MTPDMSPADAAGDLSGGEHHPAAGKVHHGQGVPAEGGADAAGVQDPAPQCGAVQGRPTVQVSDGGCPRRRAPRKPGSGKGALHQLAHLVSQVNRALGGDLEL